MKRKPDALLILDNLDDPSKLNREIAPGFVILNLPCPILFTTRQRELGRSPSIEVTVLPEDAALRLLLRYDSRRPTLAPAHPEQHYALAICHMLGGLPLALELGWVWGLAMVPSGDRAISSASDGFRIWDLTTGQCLAASPQYDWNALPLVLTPQGDRAISGSQKDRTLVVVDLSTGQRSHTHKWSGAMVTGVCVTSEGDNALFASQFSPLRVWNLRDGSVLARLYGNRDFRGMALSSDDAVLVVGDHTGRVYKFSFPQFSDGQRCAEDNEA